METGHLKCIITSFSFTSVLNLEEFFSLLCILDMNGLGEEVELKTELMQK